MSAVREKVTCWEWAFAPAQRPVGRDGGEWARISGASCSLPPYLPSHHGRGSPRATWECYQVSQGLAVVFTRGVW